MSNTTYCESCGDSHECDGAIESSTPATPVKEPVEFYCHKCGRWLTCNHGNAAKAEPPSPAPATPPTLCRCSCNPHCDCLCHTNHPTVAEIFERARKERDRGEVYSLDDIVPPQPASLSEEDRLRRYHAERYGVPHQWRDSDMLAFAREAVQGREERIGELEREWKAQLANCAELKEMAEAAESRAASLEAQLTELQKQPRFNEQKHIERMVAAGCAIDFDPATLDLIVTNERAASLAERISELERSEEFTKQLQNAKLPCGHLNQYGYTDDAGKHIVCLMCERTESAAQIEEVRRTLGEHFYSLSTGCGCRFEGDPPKGKHRPDCWLAALLSRLDSTTPPRETT